MLEAALLSGCQLAGSASMVPATDVPIAKAVEVIQPLPTAARTGQPPTKNAPVYPLSQTLNGIKVTVLSAGQEGEFFAVDVCFDFPMNNPEWMLGGPDSLILNNGVEEIGVYSIHALGPLKTDIQGNYTGRCDHVQFPISTGTKLENLQIVLKKLQTSMPESPDCAKIQAKLDQAKSGIVVRCVSGVQSSGFEIVSKPTAMDQKTAENIVSDALTDTLNGPWVFDIGTP